MTVKIEKPVWKQAKPISLGGWRISIVPLVTGAVAFRLLHFHPLFIFLASALSLIPLASLLGEATEQLAAHSGAAVGGLLNATLGNATEIILGILALWSGHIEVVKASITGSIIGNLLLVFGLAVLLAGIKQPTLSFDRTAMGANTSMLFLAVVALVMPAVFGVSVYGKLEPSSAIINRLSLMTSLVLLLSYFASLVFIFRTHKNLFRAEEPLPAEISRRAAVTILVMTTVLIAVASELLVGQIEFVTRTFGWTELFLGIVVVASVGNAAEHSTAVTVALKGKMDLALGVAIGSSTQIALFVAPLLVLVSQLRPVPMSLVFHPLEIASVILSVGVVSLVSGDGETNWFEGLQLLSVYIILAVFFYFLPAAGV
jgi:Ca2+:H+ antiporter